MSTDISVEIRCTEGFLMEDFLTESEEDMDRINKNIARARGCELETPWPHKPTHRVLSPKGYGRHSVGGSPANGERPPSRDSGIDVSMEFDGDNVHFPREIGNGTGYTKTTDRNSNIVVPRSSMAPLLHSTSPHKPTSKTKWCSTPRETATHPAEQYGSYASALGDPRSARMLTSRSISVEDRGHDHHLRDKLRRAISPDENKAFEILPSRRRPPYSPSDSVH